MKKNKLIYFVVVVAFLFLLQLLSCLYRYNTLSTICNNGEGIFAHVNFNSERDCDNIISKITEDTWSVKFFLDYYDEEKKVEELIEKYEKKNLGNDSFNRWGEDERLGGEKF